MSQRTERQGLALIVICMVQLMVVLDVTIVNVALPTIHSELGISLSNLQWVMTGYGLGFGGFLLLGGRAGDLFGRRAVFMAGVGLFLFGSLLAGCAGSGSFLIGSRVLQGLGAAFASPTALALISTTFPEPRARGRALATYAAMSGVGAASGLIAGGVLTQWLSWRWAFWVNVPLGVAVLGLTPRVLSETPRQRGQADVAGAVTVTAGMTLLVYALSRTASAGWGDPTTLLLFLGSGVLIGAFIGIEGQRRQPLLPREIVAHRSRGPAYLVMLGVGATLLSLLYFSSQFLQEVLGFGAVKAGLGFVPYSIAMVAMSQVTARHAQRINPWAATTAGAGITSAAAYWLSQINEQSSYATAVLPPLVVAGLGMGLLFVPLTLAAITGVREQDAGVSAGVLDTAQQIGGALGIAALGALAANVASHTAGPAEHAMSQGSHAAFTAASGALAVTALIALSTLIANRRNNVPANNVSASSGDACQVSLAS